MVLRSIERRLERLMSDGVGRVLPGGVRPLDIARRIGRELADSRSAGVQGLPVVANEFRVLLAPADLQRFEGVREALARELCESARATARERRWTFMGPVRVDLRADPGLRDGSFSVSARMQEAAPHGGVLHLADGRRVALGSKASKLGRLAGCTVAFDDPDVSREHAEIRPDDAGYLLVDLNSTNGTLVNGVATNRHRLADGDLVSLGTAPAFEFRSG